MLTKFWEKSVMHFWHQLHEQYAGELELLDDEDDDEDDRKGKKRSEKKVAQAKAKAEREKNEKESMAENAQSAATPVSDQAKDAQPSDFETMSAAAAQANEDAYRAEEEKKAESEERERSTHQGCWAASE